MVYGAMTKMRLVILPTLILIFGPSWFLVFSPGLFIVFMTVSGYQFRAFGHSASFLRE